MTRPPENRPTPDRPFGVSLAGLRGLAVGAACAVVVLLLLVRESVLDRARLVEALRSIGPMPMVVGMVGGVGVIALQTVRWLYVTHPVVKLRFRDAFATLLVGGLLNAVLPARGGDVLRVQYLSDRTRASRATLLGTEIVDFWADKAGWLPAFALFASTWEGAPPTWMYRTVAVMTALAAVLLAGLAIVRARRTGLSMSAGGFRGRFAAGLTASGGRRLAVAGLCLAALPWAWEALVISRAADLAGLSLGPFQAFAVLTAFNVATVVPVPGNMGVFEAASSSVLVSFGVPLERAVTFAFLYHASQLLPYVIGGSLALLAWRRAGENQMTQTAPITAPLGPKAR